MILSITKIALNAYSKLPAFFKFNGQIIQELKQSECKKYKITGSLNLKTWYTMTLWQNEQDLHNFYTSGTHKEAMKQSRSFSSNIQSKRIEKNDLIGWKEAKQILLNK